MAPPISSMGDSSSTGFNPAGNMLSRRSASGFGGVEDYVKRTIASRLRDAISNGIDKAFRGSGSGGFSEGVNKEEGKVSERLSSGGAAGVVLRGTLGVGAALYGMMPNVTEAVSQRMASQEVSSMLGGSLTAQQLISQSNNLIGGGATSSLSAQMAMGTMSGVGILPTMGGYSNIMNQVGGLSVLTGMGNEQVAGAFAGINSMNFLRMGIAARDTKGQLKDPASIANDLYSRMYGNRKLTEAQAAQIFNPHSKGYANLVAVSGGDQNLVATLQKMIYYQGTSNSGQKLDLSDSKKVMDDILGLPKDDPSRAQFRFNTSEARKLEATGSGLVGGYSAALNSTAAVNDAFSRLAESAPAVADAFGKMAGFIDTLPFAGNTGMTMFGLGSAAANTAMTGVNAYLTGRAIGTVGPGIAGVKTALGGTRLGSLAAKAGALGGGAVGKAAGKLIPGVGAALTAYDTYRVGKHDEGFSLKHLAGAATSGAVVGGLAGSPFGGPIGAGVGALAGGLIGAATYGLSYAFGGDAEKTGPGQGATSNNNMIFQPANGAVTADYGQRPKNNTYWQMLGYHSGRDFGAKKGSPVRSYRSGVVVTAGRGALGEPYGNVVEVDHGTHRSMYAHLSSIGVSKGSVVDAGAQIGTVGDTGSGAQGAHLHFEIRQGRGNPKNTIKDPRPYLSGKAGGMNVKFANLLAGAIAENTGAEPASNVPGGMASLSGAISTSNTGISSNLMSTSQLLGYGGDASKGGQHDHCKAVTIEMNVNISNSSTQEASRLAHMVKDVLEREMRYSKIGEY